jgi:hypothetical protein
MNKTASQIGAAVFTKLGLLGRRLDSGAATNRAALRQKYIDAGWDDPSADLYSRNAAQKLFKEHGAMGMRQAVSGFQAPSGAGMGPIVGVLRTNKTASQIADTVYTKLAINTIGSDIPGLDKLKLDSINLDKLVLDKIELDTMGFPFSVKKPSSSPSLLRRIGAKKLLGGGLLASGAAGLGYGLLRDKDDKKSKMKKTSSHIADTILEKVSAEMKDVFVTGGKMRVKAYPSKEKATSSAEYKKSVGTDRPFHFIIDKDAPSSANKTASHIAGEVLYKLGFGADAAFAELDASTSSGTSRPSRSNSPAAAAKAMTVAQPKPAAPPPPAVAAAPTPAASPTAGKPSSNFAPAARNLPAPKPVAAPAASSPPALNPPPAARQQRRRPLMSMQQIRNARARQQYGG